MLLGCIGDDFTGSSDLAQTLQAGGLRTIQYCGIPRGPAEADVEAGVVALKSRTMRPDLAVAQSLDALRWLQEQGCAQILFKICSTFDSTAEGNIGPVAEALARNLGTEVIPVCPAFPTNGRRVFSGHLFVGDRLLSESGMQTHPLTPMTDPDIRRWLAAQTALAVNHLDLSVIREGEAAVRQAMSTVPPGFLVMDATSDADLRTIAAAVERSPLLVGASGLGLGLPENIRSRRGSSAPRSAWRGSHGPCAILSGSCSEATRAQIAFHARQHPTRKLDVAAILEGRTTPGEIADWVLAQGGLPLVHTSAEPDEVHTLQELYGRDRTAESLERFFAELASALVQRGFTRLIVAGGETAGAVVSGLRLEALEIGPEIAPGAPALREGDIVLALKSGNFGDREFFRRAAEILSGPGLAA